MELIFWRKAAFVYPVQPAPRTAVLESWFLKPWFRTNGSIRAFPGWCAEAAEWQPAAIAGTWSSIEPLLDLKIESLTHAVIILSRPGEELLTASKRQRVWSAFGVPVFEQIIGKNGVLLAAECQAHEGLHIESARFSPGAESLETAVCGCGRTGPRLKPNEQTEEIRTIAAYAR